MIKLFSSNIIGFCKNPKLGSAIAKNSQINECYLWCWQSVDYQSYLTSTHTNCLIQLLKNSWLSLSSQPRRAFYSSLLFRQAISKISFQTQPLALQINFSLSSAGGEFYSVSNRCQHPLYTAFDQLNRSTNRTKLQPCQPGAFYADRSALQPLISS